MQIISDDSFVAVSERHDPSRRRVPMLGARRAMLGALAFAAALLAGCATLPPGLDAPKTPSTALADPETTTLGRHFAAAAKAHPDESGFDLLSEGAQSFAMHLEIAARAERTLDVQYFLLHQDDTGKLVLESVLEAADRGVHVRVLLDDTEAFDKGSTLRPLAAHPNIELRIFNPFVVRRELSLFRWAEFIVGGRRLNYRMHNKLFVADNAVALTGGRNVGDTYFQASDSEHNLGDFDLVVAGPMVRALSRSFDLYWNDRLAVPVEAMPLGKPSAADLEKARTLLAEHRQRMVGSAYVNALPKRDRLAAILDGSHPLVWAHATLAYDPPDKKDVAQDGKPGTLIWDRVAKTVEGAQRELIIISPYLVPGDEEMALVKRLRERGVRVRMLTNSLASTDMPIAHAGYIRYRAPLLAIGCELYEVRQQPGEPEAHGLVSSGGSGQFGLHAKVFVVDRTRAFVGSMNFDQRSMDVNTEIGVIIDSPRIAADIATRFEAITQPANSYRIAQGENGQAITWTTEEGGRTIQYDREPAVDAGKLALVGMLSLLPLDPLL